MLSGSLLWVEPLGWDELGQFVSVEGDAPALQMHLPVMSEAQQAPVGQAGGAAVGPVVPVVGMAGGGRPVAAGHHAALVPGDDRSADRGWEGALPTAHVEGLAGASEHDRHDPGVAGGEARLDGAQDDAGAENPGGGQPGAERGVVQ